MRTFRTVVAIGFMVLGSAGSAEAARYGMAGCGLGSAIIETNDMMQIFAATTNNLFGNQTFGITSGTSNCVDGAIAAALYEQEQFIKANFASLAKEMAQGEGETLTAFVDVLGCQADAHARAATALQVSYDQIFLAPGALGVLDRAKVVLRSDDGLSQSCARIAI